MMSESARLPSGQETSRRRGKKRRLSRSSERNESARLPSRQETSRRRGKKRRLSRGSERNVAMSQTIEIVIKSLECQAAVCQMTSTNNKYHNYQIVLGLVERAKAAGATMVFLPEGLDFIATSPEEAKELAEPIDGPLMLNYCGLAYKHQMWLSIGGFHEKVPDENKVYNTHFLIDNNGDVVAKYRKLHLFDVDVPEQNLHLQESASTSPGDHLIQPMKTSVGVVGLGICYDMRFPEMSTILRKSGANVLTYPSAFTRATGELHWEALLRARAIENQCYVMAAAQIGKHNPNRTSYGKAMIVDPRGTIVGQCSAYNGEETEPEVAYSYISSSLLKKIRTEMPVFKHRRDDVYTLTCNKVVPKVDDDPNRKFMFAKNEIPAGTVFCETNYSYAFTNIRCVVPGHVLVASKRVAKRLSDLDSTEISDLFNTVVKVQKAVEKAYECKSSTIVVQDGVDAGQTVKHVHVHVLPRKEGDFQRNDDIYDALARHDKPNSEIPIRNVHLMESEAFMIKRHITK